jgi:hypothetical protein
MSIIEIIYIQFIFKFNQTITIMNSNEVSKSTVVSEITIDRVYVSDFQKQGTKTLQLRQIVQTTSSYPSKKVGNEFSDNLFATKDYGFKENTFVNKQNRVFFMSIPVNAPKEAIIAKVKSANASKAVLYRKIANKPILTSGQEYSISQGQKTMEDYAGSQVVRHPETKEVVLDESGNPQYRIICFSETPKADEDFRGQGDVYLMEGMKGEVVAENTNWSLSENDNLPF